MSRKDSLIHIETDNVRKLTDALGNLLVNDGNILFFGFYLIIFIGNARFS